MKSTKRVRARLLTVWVTEQEMADIKRLAASRGMTVSELVRSRVLAA